jgi:hypothetical protein
VGGPVEYRDVCVTRQTASNGGVLVCGVVFPDDCGGGHHRNMSDCSLAVSVGQLVANSLIRHARCKQHCEIGGLLGVATNSNQLVKRSVRKIKR